MSWSKLRFGVAAAVAGLVLGCSDDTTLSGNGTGGSAPTPCPAGEWPRDDGTCVPAGLPPDLPCPPGEWPRDDGTCAQAGVLADGCGQGFVPNGERGCEPILPADPCPSGQLAIPGEDACHPVAPCAPGTWGNIPTEADTEFVDASFQGVSDGSEGQPWKTIQDAVDAAAPGAVVAVAAGTYPEFVWIEDKAVRLWGVCPEQVTIEGPEGWRALEVVNASGAEVHQLAITGAHGAIIVHASTGVLLEHLWLHHTAYSGLFVSEDVIETEVTLRRSLLEQTTAAGTTVWQGGELTVEETMIVDVQGGGQGVVVGEDDAVLDRGAIAVRQSVIDGCHAAGIGAAGADLEVRDSLVRNVVGTVGGGILALASDNGIPSSIVVERSVVARAGIVGIGAIDTLSTEIINTTVVDSTSLGGLGSGVALNAQELPPTGVHRIRSSTLSGNDLIGLFLSGTVAEVETTLVADTRTVDGIYGHGVEVQTEPLTDVRATALLRGLELRGNHGVGLMVLGSTVVAESIWVRDTHPRDSGEFGRGINVSMDHTTRPAHVRLSNSLVEGCEEIGMSVFDSVAHVRWTLFRDNVPNPLSFGQFGVSMAPEYGTPGRLELEATRIEAVLGFGLLVVGAHAIVRGSVVSGTLADTEGLFGDGAVVAGEVGPARVDLMSSVIETSTRAGLAAFGAEASIAGVRFRCNTLHLNGEPFANMPFSVTDGGDNVCECGGQVEECVLLSTGLAPPPEVVGPVPE